MTIGGAPDVWQADVLTAEQRQIILNCSRQAGKSTLAIVEQSNDRYDVVDLRRWRLGTSYPAIVADVTALRLQPPLLDNCTLVVDATGVGRPVVDLFEAAGCRPVGVMITAGTQAHRDDETGYWMVPKKELVSSVQVGLQTSTVRIARSLPEMQTLAQELTQFQAKITAAANVVTGAWREGQHDDLVLALALAVWYATHHGPVVITRPKERKVNVWANIDGNDRKMPTFRRRDK